MRVRGDADSELAFDHALPQPLIKNKTQKNKLNILSIFFIFQFA
jgi:hypothetical protein